MSECLLKSIKWGDRYNIFFQKVYNWSREGFSLFFEVGRYSLKDMILTKMGGGGYQIRNKNKEH